MKIDLSTISPLFVDSKVNGDLTIMTMNNEQILYPIEFELVCKSDSDYCTEVNSDDSSNAEESSGTGDTSGGENTNSESNSSSDGYDAEENEEQFYDDEDEVFDDEEYGEYDDE